MLSKWLIRLLKIGLLLAGWYFLGSVVLALALVLLVMAAMPSLDLHLGD